jgi:hypothetical protein
MVHLNEMILAQDDPFEFIYECLSMSHGHELYDYVIDMYSQIGIDYHLHPDDDFEHIIELMLDHMEET